MSKHEDLPTKIGYRKLRLWKHSELRSWRRPDYDQLWRRVCRFLRQQVGQLWSDIWPKVDRFLRDSGVERSTIADVRQRLLDRLLLDTRDYRSVRSNGICLHIDEDNGTLLATPPERHPRFRPQITYSAAELRREPTRIRK